MKATVCQLPDDPQDFACEWERLVAHVRSESSQFILLPEMPFSPWFARAKAYRSDIWQAAVDAHARWLERLPELAPATVLGSRPLNRNGHRLNEGFTWNTDDGYRAAHHKSFLPDEVGFWEASWYERGDGAFQSVRNASVGIGFAICTDLWFLEGARQYGKQRINILAHPRGTELATNDKWLVAGRAAAIVSGAFCLSSNRVSPQSETQPFGGQGWIIDPDGNVLGLTCADRPFITFDIELAQAEEAKSTYPRYAIT